VDHVVQDAEGNMIKDLLAAGRIANLPTVWTNVLVGAALVMVGQTWDYSQRGRLALVMLAGSLLYVAGCFYNDYYDRHWDAEHKPERAIPSGRLSASLLGWLILLFAPVSISELPLRSYLWALAEQGCIF